MILCFSATGNSLAAAQIVAGETGDRIVDLGAAYKIGEFDQYVSQGEDLGLIFPVYAWSTPAIIDDFIRKVNFITDNGKAFVPGYCYCVITCGSQVGNTAGFLATLLQKYQGIHLDASFSVKGVGNCIYLYAPAQGRKQEELLEQATRQAKEVAHLIDGKRMVHNEHKGAAGVIASKITCREEKNLSIEPFHTLPTCIGCGTCMRLCPTNTIHMEDGHPVWSGDACTQCLACIHRCPNTAAQYGKKTQSRPRYVNPIFR